MSRSTREYTGIYTHEGADEVSESGLVGVLSIRYDIPLLPGTTVASGSGNGNQVLARIATQFIDGKTLPIGSLCICVSLLSGRPQ